MNRDPGIYVDHMLEAIANIEADMAGSDFEKFRQDRRVRQRPGDPNCPCAARFYLAARSISGKQRSFMDAWAKDFLADVW